ncbi:uncharacterized protein Nmag_3547 [Natrialba magadii ATCC 43099]|uniref:Uncharacterized protein n=1 Tax=Natrialba magadii (strain ATCC 43099 / DSM 3394 / CCM 3739 / CIP 104546 / IAM 13178 / JCM 8861 / NBRC 102185 / NCIMB 2190 / MS3) TaxID=547559 RepID=D3SU08_NATMM|nr:hypothetical protein [Natrialba magadii]ADD07097.1 uncharacterized protein Nmag_3547 [Natrialba magadii ATCC 43099]ELY28760.1 hypothetical protein C500_12480 [Natrialba magadii ATCC 43099]
MTAVPERENALECDNCQTSTIAYTLTTHDAGTDGEKIDLHFCSSECLRVWT